MGMFLNIVGAIALFIAGLMCMPANQTGESTTLKRFLDAAAPHKGWFGIILSIWGLWGVLGAVFGIRALGSNPLGWLTNAATSVLCVGAGFLLGYEMIQKRFLLNASDLTKDKVETTYKWLSERQSSVSLLALGVAGWLILYSVIFSGRIHF
jgi:hypothetical protein